jgi:biotin transporter BioY
VGKQMSKFVKNIWEEKIWSRRIALIIADMLVVVATGLFALLTRFEFKWTDITPEFKQAFAWSVPFLVCAAFLVLWVIRL